MFSNIQAWVASVSLQNLPANCLKLRSKDTSALNFTWDKPASQRTNQFDDEGDLLLHETSVFSSCGNVLLEYDAYTKLTVGLAGGQNCSSWSIKSLVKAWSWTNTIYNEPTINIYNLKVQYMPKANIINSTTNWIQSCKLAWRWKWPFAGNTEILIWNVKCRSGSFAGVMFVAHLECKRTKEPIQNNMWVRKQ